MRKIVTILSLCILGSWSLQAQEVQFKLNVPTSYTDGFTPGVHSGARDMAGPIDSDGDGHMEVIVADYSGGGRFHVVENVDASTWELVYSSPIIDTGYDGTENIRAIATGDLDGDGNGEVVFLMGRSGGAAVSTTAAYPSGLVVFESQGDNDFGTEPVDVYEFDGDLPNRWRVEQILIEDVDMDGHQEVMFGNNGSNYYDNWYVLSVTGDFTPGFRTGFVSWNEELRLSTRASEAFDPVDRGGGSPYAIVPADLDGDGHRNELILHSWNNFNFTMVRATGPDTYEVPDVTATNHYLQASDSDDVSFFGGVAVDIDGNGDEEVFFPNLSSATVWVINYESGENTLEITSDQIVNVIPFLTDLGIGAGDLDQDGFMELYGSGSAYSVGQYNAGNDPGFLRVVEMIPGHAEDPTSYTDYEDLVFESKDNMGFNTINQTDSTGVETTYLETGSQGPEFVSKMKYLGDIDGDGYNELAMAFQGVDDSLFTYTETWNPTGGDGTGAFERVVASSEAYGNRVFMRIIEGRPSWTGEFSVDTELEKLIIPEDYVLHENYPNPFNPSTTLSFTLPLDKTISLKVYDMTGRLVDTVIDNVAFAKGTHTISWEANNIPSGNYVYTLVYGNYSQSKMMTLLK